MKTLVTQAIILTRTDYGEADRILTLLTPHYGKLRLLAKGVRRVKSKLAGGIELFSVSDITFIRGRGEIGTLVSTRLITHYGTIVTNLDRTMTGYDLIKQLHTLTEDEAESAYFDLLQHTFEALNQPEVSLPMLHFWFEAQLLQLEGQAPNLQRDTHGQPLDATVTYSFSFERMALTPDTQGRLGVDEVKFLRLAFGRQSARSLQQIRYADTLLAAVAPLVHMLRLRMPG